MAAERGAHLNYQTHESSIQISRPSIFDILAQESLMSGLKPAARYSMKFLARSYPNLFRNVIKYFDEWYTAFELILQNHYLKNYSASFAENFYGLKRIVALTGINISPAQRFRSIIFLVVTPYVKSKLDALYEKLKDPQTRSSLFRGTRRKIVDAFVSIYPKLNALFEFWTLLLQVGYLLSKSDVHSPWLKFAGVRLSYLTPEDLNKGSGADSLNSNAGFADAVGFIWTKLFGWLCKLLGFGLYFVQFIEWWQSNEKEKVSFVPLQVPSAPNELLAESFVVKMDPQLCPICRSKRKNDTVLAISGYVFCYSCIFNHLQRKKCCPVTKVPAGTEHLIRLYTRPNNSI